MFEEGLNFVNGGMCVAQPFVRFVFDDHAQGNTCQNTRVSHDRGVICTKDRQDLPDEVEGLEVYHPS